MKRQAYLITLLSMLLFGCSGPEVHVQASPNSSRPIGRVAVAPNLLQYDTFGYALSMELGKKGVRVLDVDQTASLLSNAGIGAVDAETSRAYRVLRQDGVDALIVEKAMVDSYGRLESVHLKVLASVDGELLLDMHWQNAWGGMKGSAADAVMSRSIQEAAEEIAEDLMTRLSFR